MIRKLFFGALMLGAATPALAQNGPPPSPYAPLQDHPTCTREELKALRRRIAVKAAERVLDDQQLAQIADAVAARLEKG